MSFNRGKFGPEALARFGGILLFFIAFSSLATAQSGPVDPTFAPTFSVVGGVRQTVVQPDGKILVVGSFSDFNNGIGVAQLIRINSDGSLDTSFQALLNRRIWSVAPLPNGKILFASDEFDLAFPKVGRLNADGSLDSTFTADQSRIGFAYSLLVQPDGKILVAGTRSSYSSDERSLNRLNADGSLDTGFNPPPPVASAFINSMTLSGSRIILSNLKFDQNQTTSQVIALNPDGSMDSTFTPIDVYATVTAQPDGKILIGGSFTTINSVSRKGIARLNADGSVDQTFNPGIGIDFGSINVIFMLPDGKLLIGGQFINYNGTARRNIARINSDGSLDEGFNPTGGTNNYIESFSRLSDGRLMVGGSFSTYGGASVTGLVRTTENGNLDTGFSINLRTQGLVTNLAVQPDDKIIVAGYFNRSNNVNQINITRLNPDGTADPSFFQNASVTGYVDAITIQSDGKILIAGGFVLVNDIPRRTIARLNADGTLDTTFIPASVDNFVSVVAPQADGKIVIGGQFNTVGGQPRPSLARLNADGTLDSSFVPVLDPTDTFQSNQIVIQPNGKILTLRTNGLIRLNADGTVDTGFTQVFGAYQSFVVQSDGRIVTLVNLLGQRVIRLNPDGSEDTSFNSLTVPREAFIWRLANAPGNRILLLASFVTYTGPKAFSFIPRGYISRLNSDGTNDPTFAERLGIRGQGRELATQSDGRILLAGPIESIGNSNPTNNTLNRINASISDSCSFAVTPTSFNFSQAGGDATLTVTAASDCVWTSANVPDWIFLIPTISAGTQTIPFRVRPNTGAARTATFTVAGQTITVTQAATGSFTPGAYRPSNGFVYQRNANTTGFADNEFFYGSPNDIPVAGDWNGDGIDTIGVFRNGQFFLRNSNDTGFADLQFAFGAPGDIPIAGDWNGDGVDTVGIVRGNQVFLRNFNTTGDANLQFTFGAPGDLFIVGDWDGDGIDTIGAFRPANGFVFLRNSNSTGFADIEFFYGLAGDRPIAGDWDNNGVDTIGVVRGNQWFLRNSNSTGFADIVFTFGTDSDIPLVGDWNGLP
jgi:uncharacterized delta-60 repeat protein